ncbi:MAG: sodium:proton antiporter [Clostridiales Family XIII bacterium]|jgi:CPA1 family monovalent cation:H+ antiporter|nr:sodium:proton antiporter [Clostridiales Family XIII bacterium]
MELTTLLIVLLIAIVISNLLDSAFPKLPLPIIQIGLGVLIALVAHGDTITLNPEIFMGLLIAPILFREAEEADIYGLWKVRRSVLFLVFGLVFLTVFVIGFSVHAFVPVIPLAACFCLGAILGPTDAIAVASVANRVEIKDSVMNVLRGEFLINDATGVISFSFAALALVTGSFSLVDASLKFLLTCAGGLAVGLVIGSVKILGMRALKKNKIHSTAAFMLIEILTPFLCFFAAEAIGWSGIIAAVAAGSRQAFQINRLELYEAEFASFKKSMWEMVNVVFNSIIFILLGLQLPKIVESVMDSADYTIGFALQIGLFATGVLFAVRFFGTFFAARESGGEKTSERIRNWFILTLSGVKGTVSLATAFSLPLFIGTTLFEQRDLLLLITACAIIYSLVISIVLLPIIATKRTITRKNEAHIAVLIELIGEVERMGGECVSTVSLYYKKMIRAMQMEDYGDKERKLYQAIKDDFTVYELDELVRCMEEGTLTLDEFVTYRHILSAIVGMVKGSAVKKFRNRMLFILKGLERPRPFSKRNTQGLGQRRLQEIFWANTGAVIEKVTEKYGEEAEPIISIVIEERIDLAGSVMDRTFGEGLKQKLHEEFDRELLRSFDIERGILDRHIREGLIQTEVADKIRTDIDKLEIYTIEDVNNELATRLVLNRDKRSRKRISDKVKKQPE